MIQIIVTLHYTDGDTGLTWKSLIRKKRLVF